MKAASPVRRWFPLLAALAILFLILAVIIWRHSRREATRVNSPNPAASSMPTGLAFDHNGNLYVDLQKQNRILRISTTRHVEVVAGNGRRGFSGDGGPADRASLDSPVGIALDSAGNLFIADTGNNRIRRVDANTHTISTVAGNGTSGGWVGVLATATGLYQPISIAVDDDDNLYIGGTTSLGVRRVDSITHIVSNIIGAGLPGDASVPEPAAGPFWVAIGADGSILFSDPSRNTVSQVDVPETDAQTIAGNAVCGFSGDGGPAIGALLCFPEALAVHKEKILIADTGNNRIRQVDRSTGIISTVAGNGEPGYAGDDGPALSASLKGPMGIAVDDAGDVYIADTGNDCIRRLDAKTGTITTWATARNLAFLSPE